MKDAAADKEDRSFVLRVQLSTTEDTEDTEQP
jgi:hypothetical protein